MVGNTRYAPSVQTNVSMGLIYNFFQFILDWLAAPINDLDLVLIAGQYVTFLVMGLTFMVFSIAMALARDGYAKLPKIQEEHSFFDVIMAGPIEEGVFRGVPMGIAIYFGAPVVPTLFVGTMIWSALHYKHQDVNTIFLGILFIKLFAGGYWWVAILIHSLHNAVFYLYGTTKDTDLADFWWCEEREIEGKPYYHISGSLKELEEISSSEVVEPKDSNESTSD